MVNRLKSIWLTLSSSLGFFPGLIVLGFGLLGVVLVEVDRRTQLKGMEYLFGGDGSAARTVLSVIAGSLITVAGLTFSITMVVLQLASSQFSPRILRTFFSDRLTQITIGSYVGIFVYSILVLRAVGGFTTSGFVPRVSVTVASALGIAAVCLLIAFLHHVSQMVQVSQVTARLARSSLAKTDELYPADPAERDESDGRRDPAEPVAEYAAVLADWQRQPGGSVRPTRPGYLQRVSVEDLLEELDGKVDRVAVTVTPGDFIGVESPVIELWPAAAAEACQRSVRSAISVNSQRDLDQDVDFGLRQLSDIALKAMSPGINDPMTAVTSISYIRQILIRLAGSTPLPTLIHGEKGLTMLVRRRGFEEYLESLLQINRYVNGDAWVAGELMVSLTDCVRELRSAAERIGPQALTDRLAELRAAAGAVAEQSLAEVVTERDRARIAAVRSDFDQACADVPLTSWLRPGPARSAARPLEGAPGRPVDASGHR